MDAEIKAAISEWLSNAIGELCGQRVAKLESLSLTDLLRRKNPYMFASKNIQDPEDFVQEILSAHISSMEETTFGNLLEGLAIFTAEKVHGGSKSSATGIDLEFSKDGVRHIISIKSGPNWGNSDQIKKMRSNFKNASMVIRQGNINTQVRAINGCCYGRGTKNPDKGDYWKLVGQEFWKLISGDTDFYLNLVEPIEMAAAGRKAEFTEAYERVLEELVMELRERFCNAEGKLDWRKITRFNSEKKP